MGLAMAKRFRGAGGSIAIVARRQAELDKAKAEVEEVPVQGGGTPGRVIAVSADVSNAEQIATCVQTVQKELGDVDVLVSNAGTAVAKASEEVTDEEWYGDLNLKLMAQVRFSRLLLPTMKKKKWGRIINVLNTACKHPPANIRTSG